MLVTIMILLAYISVLLTAIVVKSYLPKKITKNIVRVIPQDGQEPIAPLSNRVIPLTDEYEYNQGKKYQNANHR